MSDLEITRRSISVTLDEIRATKPRLQALGIDPRDMHDPDDREAHDIVCRIERRLNAASPSKGAA